MVRLRLLLSFFALVFASCTGSVTFDSPTHFDLDLSAYASRYASIGLVASNKIATIPCSPGPTGDALCQAAVPSTGAGSDVVLHCNAGACDPDPYPYVLDLGLQDFSELATGQIRVLDHLDLVGLAMTVDTNTTNTAVPAAEIRWGSESSSAAQLDSSTQPLAAVATVPAGQTGPVDVVLDDAGLAALTDYLHGTSSRIRFFLRTSLDVTPGQPIPSGALGVTVTFRIRASGQLR